jgi:hypothetical protein
MDHAAGYRYCLGHQPTVRRGAVAASLVPDLRGPVWSPDSTLTSCMPYKSEPWLDVAGSGSTSRFNRCMSLDVARNRRSLAPRLASLRVVFQVSSCRDRRCQEVIRVIRRKTNRRHMIDDHRGRTTGRAILQLRAVEEILGTHSCRWCRRLRPRWCHRRSSRTPCALRGRWPRLPSRSRPRRWP